jgi:hypothetical protein
MHSGFREPMDVIEAASGNGFTNLLPEVKIEACMRLFFPCSFRRPDRKPTSRDLFD